MKKMVLAFAIALLLAGTASTTAGGSRMTCQMTGQTMETCCCVAAHGAMVCTLTGETVSACCCS